MFAMLEVAITLFIILDPMGNVALFTSLLRPFSERQKKRIIVQELILALLLAFGACFVGETIFSLLQLTPACLRLNSAAVLTVISLSLLFPARFGLAVPNVGKEPFLVPLATPMLTGPTVMATLILFVQQYTSLVVIGAIICAWIPLSLILYFSPQLHVLMGERLLRLSERFFGFFLLTIAGENALKGVSYIL